MDGKFSSSRGGGTLLKVNVPVRTGCGEPAMIWIHGLLVVVVVGVVGVVGVGVVTGAGVVVGGVIEQGLTLATTE